MMSRKTIWTDLGFGDFYNELAVYNKFNIRLKYLIFVQENILYMEELQKLVILLKILKKFIK